MLIKRIRYAILLPVLFLLCGCTEQKEELPAEETIVPAEKEASGETEYHLEKMVLFSRHNLRSPISSGDAGIDAMSIYDWHEWTSMPGELSLKGEQLEEKMGEYFREWMESEGMDLSGDRMRFYANSMQRTIRTSECFLKGFMPEADIPVETHAEYGTMDPVFMPSLQYCSASYDNAIQAAYEEMKQNDQRYLRLQEDYDLLADVTGYEQTQGYAEGWLAPLDALDTQLVLYPDNPPGIEGSLVRACRLSDALLLQYYEEPDLQKAGFGRVLSEEEWRRIAEIRELYNDTQYSLELISASVAHPLLEVLEQEMTDDQRVFALICGHDANLTSVLSAFGVTDYALPHTPECHTPIGGMFAMELWKDEEGQRYVRTEMIYQNAAQIRDISPLSMEYPPERYRLSFEGLNKNEDGMYLYEEWMERMHQAVNCPEYDGADCA
ncbi:MAG: histidine-type phosphatase [Solobacterium sp.]|nr:histidine-type phosphatase [Solobacterium sp.]